MTYVVSYEVDGNYDEVAAAVYKSFYLAEIDAKNLTIRERVNGGYTGRSTGDIPGTVGRGEYIIKPDTFDYPATQKLLKHLNENPSIIGNVQGEGDWLLSDEDKAGDD